MGKRRCSCTIHNSSVDGEMGGQLQSRPLYEVALLILQLLTVSGIVVTCMYRHSEIHYSAERVRCVFRMIVRRNQSKPHRAYVGILVTKLSL
jgi:hypothetical protein